MREKKGSLRAVPVMTSEREKVSAPLQSKSCRRWPFRRAATGEGIFPRSALGIFTPGRWLGRRHVAPCCPPILICENSNQNLERYRGLLRTRVKCSSFEDAKNSDLNPGALLSNPRMGKSIKHRNTVNKEITEQK